MKPDKKDLHIRYVGFRSHAKLREYMFLVRVGGVHACEFRLTIPNEAFVSQGIRYQDGPDICAHRVQREMEAEASPLGKMKCAISAAELEEYRATQLPKSKARTAFKTAWKPTDNLVA